MHSLIVPLLMVLPLGGAAGDEPPALEILYLGNAGSPRAEAFKSFLGERFAKVTVVARDAFDPATASDVDVVLLDWAQEDVDLSRMGKIESPLGPRDEWSKPTVLLGSAGLLIASPWRTTGASG